MKKFMVLHYGFRMPTDAEMAQWNKWFQSVESRQIDRAHFPHGKEISAAGIKDLPFSEDSITGFTIIEAANLDEAASIAGECPFIKATRVYELQNNPELPHIHSDL